MIANSPMGWKLLLAALMVVALPSHASQQSGTTVRHHRVEEQSDDSVTPEIVQAEAAMQKQDYATAEALLNKAVATNPEAYRAWFDLGYLNNQTKHPTAAIYAYRKSVAAKPDVFESNLNLGILLARQGNNDEAIKYLKAATVLQPSANPNEGLARAWLSLGLVEESGDPAAALAAYAQSAKLNPKDPEPHLSAGLLLENQDKLDDAAREFQAAATLDPKATEPIAGLANVLSKQKKLPEAEAELRKLLLLDPGNGNARVQLGRVLAAEGKSDEAVKELASAKPGSDNDPQAAMELGSIYAKGANWQAAEAQFRVAVEGMPQNAAAHFSLGTSLMQQKRYPEAQEQLLQAARLKPDMAEIYGNLAVVAAENKDYALAIRVLDARVKYLPESPATYFLRATSYDNLNVKPKAVENYKQFLATDGGKMPDQEWQARHRLIAIDPSNASKYAEKK